MMQKIIYISTVYIYPVVRKKMWNYKLFILPKNKKDGKNFRHVTMAKSAVHNVTSIIPYTIYPGKWTCKLHRICIFNYAEYAPTGDLFILFIS